MGQVPPTAGALRSRAQPSPGRCGDQRCQLHGLGHRDAGQALQALPLCSNDGGARDPADRGPVRRPGAANGDRGAAARHRPARGRARRPRHGEDVDRVPAGRTMNRLVALIVPAALVAAVSLQASAAPPSLTSDQQLVAGLEQARSAARATLKGRAQPGRLAEGMRRARLAAPHAVGALESSAMQAALRASLHKQLRRLIVLTSAALDDFGVPLEKEFPAFAVNRDFAYLPEFANYSGLTATVGDEISEVVIGAADRQTA